MARTNKDELHQKGNAIRVLLPSLLSSASYISCTFFNWMSKVIRDCTGFALLCSVIGLENLSHSLNHQMHNKFLLLIQFGFTLSSHWLLKVFTFPLIGGCDYYGFGFLTLNFKGLNSVPLEWFIKASQILFVTHLVHMWRKDDDKHHFLVDHAVCKRVFELGDKKNLTITCNAELRCGGCFNWQYKLWQSKLLYNEWRALGP